MLRFSAVLLTLLALYSLMAPSAYSQTRWYDPAESGMTVIQGQAFKGQERESCYDRLPERVSEVVRDHVWNLSKENAGESIVFSTDSRGIEVRYTVAGGFEMPHMPATGVSGVDLYTEDRDGNEVWLAGRYAFRDTVTFRYRPVEVLNGNPDGMQKYTLFLPLYNVVTWMEIGVDESSEFIFHPATEEKTIVAYGTSIAQGACASRPGMAWSNILQRMLGREVVNLGFSGNAYLENEMIDLLAEIDAEVYLLDAMPNVCTLEPEQIRDTVVNAVRRLRGRKPDVPIVLVDHIGFPHYKANPEVRKRHTDVLMMQKLAYRQLKKEGLKKIYYLSYEELAMPQDGTVEGVHASDYGMMAYALAYKKKLKRVL